MRTAIFLILAVVIVLIASKWIVPKSVNFSQAGASVGIIIPKK